MTDVVNNDGDSSQAQQQSNVVIQQHLTTLRADRNLRFFLTSNTLTFKEHMKH